MSQQECLNSCTEDSSTICLIGNQKPDLQLEQNYNSWYIAVKQLIKRNA